MNWQTRHWFTQELDTAKPERVTEIWATIGGEVSLDYTQTKFPKPTKKKKPAKKKTKSSTITNRLDALVRRIVRARDQICVTCRSNENLEISHYLGRAKFGVRWDLRNTNLQCRKCHAEHHEGNPAYMRYMAMTYGEEVFEGLYLKQAAWMKEGGASAAKKAEIYENLTEELKKYDL